MLAAIAGAPSTWCCFETYIWKGDEVGERFKQALVDAAERGVEVYVIYDAFANIVVVPAFKSFRPRSGCCAYPVYNAGWRFFDLRRYGRDHRKILVGRRRRRVRRRLQHRHGRTPPSGATPTCRITGPAVWDLKRRLRRLLERTAAATRGPLLLETAGGVGAADPAAPQPAPAVDVPDPGDVPGGDQPGHAATSG